MKRNVNHLILAIGFSMMSLISHAQVNYAHIGTRVSNISTGIMARFYVRNSNAAVENLLMLERGNTGFSVSSMYEEHMIIESVKGLSWYVGAGLHGGYKCAVPNTLYPPDPDLVNYDPKQYDNSQPGRFVGGANAIIGVDYHFRNSGFHISADVKPFITWPNQSATFFDGAIKLGIDL
jgi:hypothetical protein